MLAVRLIDNSLHTDFITLGIWLYGHSKNKCSMVSGSLHVLHKPSLWRFIIIYIYTFNLQFPS